MISLLLIAVLGSTSFFNQTDNTGAAPVENSIPTLSVCTALSHASKYDGKIVRIRGRVVATEEGASFLGENCPGIYVTEGKVWPSSIAWTMPTQLDTIVHPVDFAFDEQSNKARHKKYRELRKRVPDKCIEYTYTGMFEIWSERNSRKTDPKGTQYVIPGFGHLDASPAQLVLKSADDVTADASCVSKQRRRR